MMIYDFYELLLAEWHSWRFYAGAACLYSLYYFYKVVHRPVLIAGNGEFKELLTKELGVLKTHFYPTFWAFQSHFQTICRVLFKAKPFILYRRETLITPDKGHISLDWSDNDVDNKHFPHANKRPTLVILPGITGCSDASYARNIIIEANNMGWRALVFNNRGMGKTDLKTPRTFCACNGEDLEFVLKHVSKEFPESPILIFAVSLGGVIFTNYLSSHGGKLDANIIAVLLISVPWCSNGTTDSLEKPLNWFLYNRFIVNRLKQTVQELVLTNYIARVGKPKISNNIVGALVISVAWDSFKSTESLEKPINWLFYNRHLANNLKELVQKNIDVFEENLHELPYKLEDVMTATSIREFDEKFTSKTFGFPTWQDYYTESSLTLKPLENIKIPMLFLNARDDPFAPADTIPLERIKQNPLMAIILTDYGGHIGFIEGLTVNSRSLVERLFHQYATCMLNKMLNKNDEKNPVEKNNNTKIKVL